MLQQKNRNGLSLNSTQQRTELPMISGDNGGKAENLLILDSIPGITVPRFCIIPTPSTETEDARIIESFILRVRKSNVAVRSSAKNEDGKIASFAGMYLTKLHVPIEKHAILEAVTSVRNSGDTKKDVVAHYATYTQGSFQETDLGIAVIVQEMIDADFSGMIFSHSLTDRDGYYLISVSRGVGENVASGMVNGTLYRVARSTDLADIKEDWLCKLITCMKLIEWHYRSEDLDVEFAAKNGQIYTLQCRPMTTSSAYPMSDEAYLKLPETIERLSRLVRTGYGDDLLGDMIDINPVELLGNDPSTLDISLFGHLFADSVVEQVRRDMGYDPLDIGLMRIVGNKPYVSLRASAFSFRPFGVSREVYEKLFAVYRAMLVSDEALQTRVEFDVFAMDDGEKLESVMRNAELKKSERYELRFAFRRLRDSLNAISRTLRPSSQETLASYGSGTLLLANAPLSEMLQHVVAGTRYFVQVARLAFYWKNRFQETYPGEDLNELLAGHIQTVSGRQQHDLHLCRIGQLPKQELVDRYGHLRPGQFCVFGESYADDPEHYLFSQIALATPQLVEKRPHDHEHTEEFRNVVAFMQAREESKFLFSQALGVLIGRLKKELSARGIDTIRASRHTWDELMSCFQSGEPLSADRERFTGVILPPVLVPEAVSLHVVRFGHAAPSFITRSVVKAPIRVLEDASLHEDVKGALVLIPTADPGFDFLFHSGAAGIITKTGGPASHMCVRAVELQMPACIGCGEQMYSALRGALSAILDCKSGQLVVVE
ncbi:MAG: hypothetical protein KGH79_04970 [Patescibacteria group bacterium]|nr:hypothetical protein [Patescibacteria group bacterium]